MITFPSRPTRRRRPRTLGYAGTAFGITTGPFFFSFPKKLEFPLLNAATAFTQASADFRFAAAVAQFGMILRGSPYRGTANMDDVAAWAASAAPTAADDPGGYRAEFVELVRKAQAMTE